MRTQVFKIASIASVLLASGMLAGCDPAFPELERSGWEATIKPALACQGERVNLEYRFFVEQHPGVVGSPLETARCDESRYSCSSYYPVLGVTQPGLFPLGTYHLTNYEGRVQSEPLSGAGRTNIVASVLASSATYVADDGTVIGLITTGPPWNLINVSHPAIMNVESIAAGGHSAAPVLFNGQCIDGVPSWNPINVEVGEARSSGTKLRQICNREPLRSVMFVATFNSGMSGNLSETSVAPGNCISITEAEPNIIRSIVAIPNPDPTVIGSQCPVSEAAPPPAPIRAEFIYGCDGG